MLSRAACLRLSRRCAPSACASAPRVACVPRPTNLAHRPVLRRSLAFMAPKKRSPAQLAAAARGTSTTKRLRRGQPQHAASQFRPRPIHDMNHCYSTYSPAVRHNSREIPVTHSTIIRIVNLSSYRIVYRTRTVVCAWIANDICGLRQMKSLLYRRVRSALRVPTRHHPTCIRYSIVHRTGYRPTAVGYGVGDGAVSYRTSSPIRVRLWVSVLPCGARLVT